jgi:hypothetical protein
MLSEGQAKFCRSACLSPFFTPLARYTYAPDNDGDETVTGTSALDDLHPAPDHVKLLSGVPHGKLVTDRQFLDYFYGELSHEPVVAPDTKSAADQTL